MTSNIICQIIFCGSKPELRETVRRIIREILFNFGKILRVAKSERPEIETEI